MVCYVLIEDVAVYSETCALTRPATARLLKVPSVRPASVRCDLGSGDIGPWWGRHYGTPRLEAHVYHIRKR